MDLSEFKLFSVFPCQEWSGHVISACLFEPKCKNPNH